MLLELGDLETLVWRFSLDEPECWMQYIPNALSAA